MRSQGAGCIVEWQLQRNLVLSGKVFFDRLLSMNQKQPNMPSQRPFSPDQVYAEIKKMGLTNATLATLVPNNGKQNFT